MSYTVSTKALDEHQKWCNGLHLCMYLMVIRILVYVSYDYSYCVVIVMFEHAQFCIIIMCVFSKKRGRCLFVKELF